MDKPVNKKPKLKKQEILPKRVGGIYEKSTNMKTLKRRLRQYAVAQTQQNQRKRKDKCKATERKVFRGYRQIHENNTGTSDRRQI